MGIEAQKARADRTMRGVEALQLGFAFSKRLVKLMIRLPLAGAAVRFRGRRIPLVRRMVPQTKVIDFVGEGGLSPLAKVK